MVYPEWIERHKELLETHRQTLIVHLQQQAKMGVYTPPYIIQGIAEARQHIAQIKHDLRATGVVVADLALDDHWSDAHFTAHDIPQGGENNITITGSIINGDVVSGSTTKTINNYYSPNRTNIQNQHRNPFLPLHQAIRVNIPAQRQQEAMAKASQMQAAVREPDLDLAELALALRWFQVNYPAMQYIISAIFDHADIMHTIASNGKTKDVYQLLKSIFADRKNAE